VTFPPAGYNLDVMPLNSGCEPPRTTWQEWFSWAFVMSIATACGLVVQVPVVDNQKKDLQVETWRPLDGRQRTIGLQLKSTYRPVFVDELKNVAFDLERDDYNGILIPGSIPRFLVVVAVPAPPTALVSLHDGHARLQGAAWWGVVPGPETTQITKRVKVPVDQRVNAGGLFEMLRLA
jgi:hypothetical protein